eukprot:92610_1
MSDTKSLGWLIPIKRTVGKPIPIKATVVREGIWAAFGRELYRFSIQNNLDIFTEYGAVNVEKLKALWIVMDSWEEPSLYIWSYNNSIKINGQKTRFKSQDVENDDIFELSDVHIYQYSNIYYDSLQRAIVMAHNHHENICPVCLEDIKLLKTVQTHCGHLFCFNCIRKIITNKLKCPICRNLINGEQELYKPLRRSIRNKDKKVDYKKIKIQK